MTGTLAPLRAVVEVEPTGRRGKEIGPHQFWLAEEFCRHLACGHQDLVVRCVWGEQGDGQGCTTESVAADLASRKVRCGTCDPQPVKSTPRQRPAPARDPLAVRIAQLGMAVDDDDQVAQLLPWTRTGLDWIPDVEARNRTYAAVAVALVDRALNGTDSRHLPVLREALNGWDGSRDSLGEVKRAARRLYSAQNSCSGWAAVRSAVAAAAIVPARGAASVKALDAALSWVEPARAAIIDQAVATRRMVNLFAVCGFNVDEGLRLTSSLIDASCKVSVSSFSAPLIAELRAVFEKATSNV